MAAMRSGAKSPRSDFFADFLGDGLITGMADLSWRTSCFPRSQNRDLGHPAIVGCLLVCVFGLQYFLKQRLHKSLQCFRCFCSIAQMLDQSENNLKYCQDSTAF